jgi:anti-sigma regulatory factor (Ser/Thr protein kinase)
MRTVAVEGVVGSSNQVIELLTGELVSNAVQHGPTDGDLRVGVRVDGARVRVSVRDEGPDQPRLEHLDVAAPGGRGLVLVEALSTAWGTVVHADGGKTVWFEVDTAP